MIVPDKHISFAESLLGLSAEILGMMESKAHVDDLWFQFERVNNSEHYPAYHSFDNFLLALDLLFLLGIIYLDDDGGICREAA